MKHEQADMWTDEDIWRALRDCYDPEIALNVVELGRVVSIALRVDEDAPGAGIAGVRPRQRVAVSMLGNDGSPEEESRWALLRGLVENRLLGLEGVTRVEVEMLAEPKWTPARISAAGRKLLGLDGVVFPILNNRVRG